MIPGRHSFSLEEGAELTLPAWAERTIFASKHADRFPDTPCVLPVRQYASGLYEPVAPRRKGGTKEIGRHLFIPSGVKAGETLYILWVDDRSAAAVRKKDLPSRPLC